MRNSATADDIMHRGRWLLGLVTAIAALLALGLASNAHAGQQEIAPNPCVPASAEVQDCTCDPEVASVDAVGCPDPCDNNDLIRPGDCTCDSVPTATADYVEVCKTAHTTWEKRTERRIQKKIIDKDGEPVDQQHVNLFYGDSYWANYVVGLSKRVVDVYSVHGEIHIPLSQYRNGVTEGRIRIADTITSEGNYRPIVVANVRCRGADGTLGPVPETVSYEGTLVCEYWAQVPKLTHGTNKVDVYIGEYRTPHSAYADFWFPRPCSTSDTIPPVRTERP